MLIKEHGHYENTPMQYTAIFHSCKNDNFKLKIFDYFHIFAQNIYCGYTLVWAQPIEDLADKPLRYFQVQPRLGYTLEPPQ